jgi:hypothetical protein
MSQELRFHRDKKINFIVIGRSWVEILAKFIRLRRDFKGAEIIISHSLRAALGLRLIKIVFLCRFRINLVVHQLPGLTDPKQRFKRFVYAQFSDDLYCFSKAVEASWYSQFAFLPKRVMARFSKNIKTLRNGVYLPRLPEISSAGSTGERKKIYFLGRLAFWKGVGTITSLAQVNSLIEYDFVFLIPDDRDPLLDVLRDLLGSRLIIIAGKTVASLKVHHGDVHLYPSNYGPDVTMGESISLNCLEFASIGIPSLVTRGGLYTWPDLSGLDIFHEVDWADLDSVTSTILSLDSNTRAKEKVSLVREVTDIRNQINRLVERT